ncbi:12399_t:CDS:1, partial [Cetraspora pellucida]
MSEFTNGSANSDVSTTIPFVEDDDSGAKLDPTVKQILNTQIHVDKKKRSYLQLFRFATNYELALMFIGIIFAG